MEQEDLLTRLNRELSETIVNDGVNTDNLIETLLWAGENITKNKDTTLFDKWYEQFSVKSDEVGTDDKHYWCNYTAILWKYIYGLLDDLHEGPLDEFSLTLTNLQYIYDSWLYQHNKQWEQENYGMVFDYDLDNLIPTLVFFVKRWSDGIGYTLLKDYWRETQNSETPMIKKPFDVDLDN